MNVRDSSQLREPPKPQQQRRRRQQQQPQLRQQQQQRRRRRRRQPRKQQAQEEQPRYATSCVTGPAIAHRGAIVLNGSTSGCTPHEFWPAFWRQSSGTAMVAGVEPVRTRVLDAHAFGRLMSACSHVEQRPLLISAVSRYGNHWHVLFDSFAYAWMLLVEAGLLNPTRAAEMDTSQPVVVLHNGRRTGTPDKRNACCVSASSALEASVGPWTSLWSLLAGPGAPLRTPSWLHPPGAAAPRCFRRLAMGGSSTLNYYEYSRTRAAYARRAARLRVFLAWVRRGYALPPPRAPSASEGLRLLLVERRGSAAVRRALLNARSLARRARATRGIAGVSVVDFAALPLRAQLEATARHALYVGMMGTSMANAVWLPPTGVAAG